MNATARRLAAEDPEMSEGRRDRACGARRRRRRSGAAPAVHPSRCRGPGSARGLRERCQSAARPRRRTVARVCRTDRDWRRTRAACSTTPDRKHCPRMRGWRACSGVRDVGTACAPLVARSCGSPGRRDRRGLARGRSFCSSRRWRPACFSVCCQPLRPRSRTRKRR